MLEINQIYLGDCLEVMRDIPDGSIDMILCDPPYGTTACKWDSIIPLEPMWEQLKRVIKPNGAIVLTAAQPFTTNLISSNMKMFRYTWIWDKDYSTGFANANRMPLKGFEDVLVFYKCLPIYNPQGLKEIKPKSRVRKMGSAGEVMGDHGNNTLCQKEYITKFTNYPNSCIKTKKEKCFHPTGKPISLFEYLIKTYTNDGETVLDFTIGSGTTAIAAINTNRNYIGIEKDKNYYQIAQERISNHIKLI